MTVPSHRPSEPSESDHEGPIVRDKRRIDPETGQLRQPDADGAGAAATAGPDGPVAAPPVGGASDIAELQQQLDERTADLQRVTAEYANYRKRVDRDRQLVGEQALSSVLVGLLPVLDDIDRAREHGELDGGVKSIADNLETTLTKLGLERYGSAGEAFDPTLHEAMTHGYSADVAESTCAEVFQPGYRLGERILRPARVAVVEPGEFETTPTDG